jgi:UDP-GlcNAc:undecaprenyl-phosphate GlcNAc-1-phosphate transferase
LVNHVGAALLIGLAASFCATPVIRRLALRYGAVDKPGERSVHRRPVPILGGLAIYAAFALAIAGSVGFGHRTADGILAGGAMILALGILDDSGKALGWTSPRWLMDREGRGLRPWVKLTVQVAAAVMLTTFHVRVEWLHRPLLGGYVYLGPLSVPFTVLWVIAVVNAVNLIDGLDGLAAGIASIAALTLLVTALEIGQSPAAAVLSAALFGGSVGFLPWNWSPAKIFMGDAGAMFLGFALAGVSVAGMLKSPTVIALAVPVLALGLPVFDTCFAIVRRMRQGRPIGAADRHHLHHRLMDMGLSQRETVVVMYMVSGWLAVSALALSHLRGLVAGVLLLFVAGSMVLGARRLGLLSMRPSGSTGEGKAP